MSVIAEDKFKLASDEGGIDAEAAEQAARATSAFLSPVSRITSQRASIAVDEEASAAETTKDDLNTGLPFGATSTLSSLLRAGGADPAGEEVAQTATEIAPAFLSQPTAPAEQAERSLAESTSKLTIKAGPDAATTPDSLSLAKKIASMLRPGPPFFSEMDNADLVAYIGDAKVMNGENGIEATPKAGADAPATMAAANEGAVVDAAARQSVWAALESLPVGAGWTQIPTSLTAGGGVGDDDEVEISPLPSAGNADGDEGLWTALMLTCDLPTFSKKDEQPSVATGDAATVSTPAASAPLVLDTSGLKVQLGRSVVVPTNVLKKNRFFYGNAASLGREIHVGSRKAVGSAPSYSWDDFSSALPPSSPTSLDVLGLPLISLWSWPSWVPFLGKPKASTPANGTDPTAPAPDVNKGKKRIWVPSRTKVSFLATWWGFRLYLPPPVMKSLSEDLGTAESIAKVLSTVLSFIISHVPTSVIPLPLLPLVTVLQAIAPLTGYLATFIAWAWSGISSMDKGNGIVLSATWVLPVAIIPKAWDAPIVPDDGTGAGTTPATPVPTTPAPAPAPAPAPVPAPSVPVAAPLPVVGGPATASTP
ncbi:hypothetical protein OC844_003049 [Tilletia horrida]|nr:hypothetical protein OC844_003049 [Tilletia horrida]